MLRCSHVRWKVFPQTHKKEKSIPTNSVNTRLIYVREQVSSQTLQTQRSSAEQSRSRCNDSVSVSSRLIGRSLLCFYFYLQDQTPFPQISVLLVCWIKLNLTLCGCVKVRLWFVFIRYPNVWLLKRKLFFISACFLLLASLSTAFSA